MYVYVYVWESCWAFCDTIFLAATLIANLRQTPIVVVAWSSWKLNERHKVDLSMAVCTQACKLAECGFNDKLRKALSGK